MLSAFFDHVTCVKTKYRMSYLTDNRRSRPYSEIFSKCLAGFESRTARNGTLPIATSWLTLTAMLILASLGTQSLAAENTFSGRYEYRTDEESLDVIGRQVCFIPSEPSAQKVPRSAGDKRLRWFCFSNTEAAAQMLGFRLAAPAKGCGIRGEATVTVSDYVPYTKEGDGNDIATLRAVLKSSTPISLPCSQLKSKGPGSTY
jgi:hypothetical protein